MDKTEDTTVLTTEDDSLTTTTGDDELTVSGDTEDSYETLDLDEYDYSDIEDLWEKYYDKESDGLLYSTEKLTDTTGLSDAKSFINTEAFSAIYGFIASIFVFVIILHLLYTVYKIIVKYMISKKMGRSTGFAIASIFFWPIMSGILAFSKNKASEEKGEAAPKPPVEPIDAEEVPDAPVQPSKS
jgi:hypothetical protein